jgi:hypothetical protein
VIRDATAIIGLIMLFVGCSWAWPPLGLIVCGAILILAAAWGHSRET